MYPVLVLLLVLAEAVNAVTDWPVYKAMPADEPVRRLIGMVVGPFKWEIPLSEIKRSLPEVIAKREQLERMAMQYPLPLRPYPYDQRAREIHIRHALLAASVEVFNSEMRQETAKWVTMLGRLRAAPNMVPAVY